MRAVASGRSFWISLGNAMAPTEPWVAMTPNFVCGRHRQPLGGGHDYTKHATVRCVLWQKLFLDEPKCLCSGVVTCFNHKLATLIKKI